METILVIDSVIEIEIVTVLEPVSQLGLDTQLFLDGIRQMIVNEGIPSARTSPEKYTRAAQIFMITFTAFKANTFFTNKLIL